MRCWHCKTLLTWLADHDLEHEGEGILTELECKSCNAMYEVRQQHQEVEQEKKATKFDNIKKPKHYNMTSIEAWDVIKMQLGDKFQYYLEGNILKYLLRFKWKDQNISDLNKANVYIDKLIKELEDL